MREPSDPAGLPASIRVEIEVQTPAYVISVAAELSGMHPQTLRQYDRLGLVTPGRAGGGGRRYSARDVEQLREIQRLSQEEGMNLAGVKRVMDLENQVIALQARVAELQAEVHRAHAVVAAAEAEFASGLYRRAYLPVHVTAGGGAIVPFGQRPRKG